MKRNVSQRYSKPQSSLFETRYLQSTVGPILAVGLAELVQRRPDDPIEHLATFLYRKADEIRSKKQQEEEEQNKKHLEAKKQKITNTKQYYSSNKNVATRKLNVERLKSSLNTKKNSEILIIEFRETELHRKAAMQNVNLSELLNANYLSIAVRNQEEKTPRDVALTTHLQDNVNQIDQFCFKLLENGNTQAINDLILIGYIELVDRLKTIQNINKSIFNFINDELPKFLDRITSFKAAIVRGNKLIVEFIITYHKKIVFYRNSKGSSSLHDAIENRQFHIALYLIEKCPSLTHVKDIHHRTGFDLLNIINTAGLNDKQYDLYNKLQQTLLLLTPE